MQGPNGQNGQTQMPSGNMPSYYQPNIIPQNELKIDQKEAHAIYI